VSLVCRLEERPRGGRREEGGGRREEGGGRKEEGGGRRDSYSDNNVSRRNPANGFE
jgi:hypothetical protein